MFVKSKNHLYRYLFERTMSHTILIKPIQRYPD